MGHCSVTALKATQARQRRHKATPGLQAAPTHSSGSGLFHAVDGCPRNGPACQGGGGAGDLANLYLGKRAVIRKAEKGIVPIAESVANKHWTQT